MAHNINKLHNKIQSDRTETHLFPRACEKKSVNYKYVNLLVKFFIYIFPLSQYGIKYMNIII